jgi:Na+/melibiose symporter-like transporter
LTGIVVAFAVIPAVLGALSLPMVRRYDLSSQRLGELLEGSRLP